MCHDVVFPLGTQMSAADQGPGPLTPSSHLASTLPYTHTRVHTHTQTPSIGAVLTCSNCSVCFARCPVCINHEDKSTGNESKTRNPHRREGSPGPAESQGVTLLTWTQSQKCSLCGTPLLPVPSPSPPAVYCPFWRAVCGDCGPSFSPGWV